MRRIIRAAVAAGVLALSAGCSSGSAFGSFAIAPSQGSTSAAPGARNIAPSQGSTSAALGARNIAPSQAGVVSYACTGSAPDGVDITYGPTGTLDKASHLPFAAHGSVDESIEYYSLEATLKGAGSVHCTVTVRDRGVSTTSSKSATGFNTAYPEECAINDVWQACS